MRVGNTLVFSGLTPRGLKAQAYPDLLVRHHRAALARAALARRGNPEAADGTRSDARPP